MEETSANEAKGLEKGEEVDITAKDKENPETEASKETPENERKDQEMKEVEIDENETGKEDKEETVSSRRKRHSSKTSSSTQNTPLRRSHRRVSSQSTKQEEKLEIVSEPALVPSKRQRHSSRDSTDSSAPLRRSRRISQSSHEGDQLIGTTEAVSAKPRRSRRVSQTSNDSDNPETPLKSSKRLAQKRTSTPRSTSKPKLEKKPLPMEPLTEEIEESNLDSIVQPAPRRKRQLSEASKLTAIIEEPTAVVPSPKKRGRKSTSATAVMQRTTRRSTMQGQSKTEENDPVKKSTSNPVKSRKAAVESSPVETIFEEAMDPEIEISPEKPETSKTVRPKRKTVSASSVPQKTPLTRSRSQATSAAKVIDHVFSPMAKSEENLATGTSEDEPKRSKRFSVRAKRTSYKF